MIIKLFAPIIISSLLFAACCNCGKINKTGSPEEIQKKADLFVISKTGEEFFTKYIKADYDKTTQIKDGYLMVYSFSIPEREGINGEIRFSIDSLGNVQTNKEVVGIPDCLSTPGNCDFNISGDEVKNIARQAGFEEGIKDWEVDFVWSNDHKKYLWQIRATTSETKGTEFYRGSGKFMLIDPNNGTVIETKDWRVN